MPAAPANPVQALQLLVGLSDIGNTRPYPNINPLETAGGFGLGNSNQTLAPPAGPLCEVVDGFKREKDSSSRKVFIQHQLWVQEIGQ